MTVWKAACLVSAAITAAIAVWALATLAPFADLYVRSLW